MPHNLIYKDELGYIAGYEKDDFWWITEFVVYPQFRGKRKARELAKKLPTNSKLLAYPLYNMAGPHLPQNALITFYHSIGFVKQIDEYNNAIMVREK